MQESPTLSTTVEDKRQLRKSVRLSSKVTKSSKKLKIKSKRLSSSDKGASVSNEARSKFSDQADGIVPNQPLAEDHVSTKRRKKGMHSKSSSRKKKRRKHSTEDEEERGDEKEGASFNKTGGKNMSEERRALHRVHERQRHQSLNDAIQELVKVLPPGDVYRNVTKFNVLRKANDYIDFLQYKINHLCLDGSIELKKEDCRFSFSVPLKATFDGKELKIPASTPISPKVLRGIKKSARIVSANQEAEKMALKPNKVRTPRTPTPRYSGLRSKKTPREKLKTGDTQNTTAEDYLKEVSHRDLGGYSEEVPHTVSRGSSREVPQTDPRDYPKEVPNTDSGGYSKEDSHTDQGGCCKEVPHTDPRPATPQREDMFESDQGELVVDEEPLSLRESASAEIDNPCTFKQKPNEPSKPLPIVSRKTFQRRKIKKLWQRKAATLGHAPSTPLDREQRKRLLDFYISADSSPDSAHSMPTATSKPAGVPDCASSSPSGNNVDFEGETPYQIPCANHQEHSYSTKSHQSNLTGTNSEARLPSELSPVGDSFNQPIESSQVNPSETSTSQVKTHNMGPGYLCTNDCYVSFCQIGRENLTANSTTAMPTWKTKETTLSKNADLGCSRVMQTRGMNRPILATSVPLLYPNVIESTSSVSNPSAKSTSVMGIASNDTATTAPCHILTSSASLMYQPAEASSSPFLNMMTESTAEIVTSQHSTAKPIALDDQSTATCATLPTQTLKISKASEDKLLHYSIILPTSIRNPPTVPTLQATPTKQQISTRKTEPLQSFTFMPSTLAQHAQAATTPQTPTVTSCETALLHYSTVYPAAPVHQSTNPDNLPIKNLWTSQSTTSESHHYFTFMPNTQMQKNRSATNLPATTSRTTAVAKQHSVVMPTAQGPQCTVPSSTPNMNSSLLSSGKTVSLHYTTVLPNTRIYYTTATSKTIPTQYLRKTSASRTAPQLFPNTVVCQSTAASTVPVQNMLTTSSENTPLRSPTVISSSVTQHDSVKFTFMPTAHQQAAPISTLPVQHRGTTLANGMDTYYYAPPVLTTQVTTATMATARAMSTNNTFMTLVPKTFPHRQSNILPNTILHHTTVPTAQPIETAQTTDACETARNYVTTATSSQAAAAPTLTTTEQSKSTPQRYVPIQPATTGSNDTAPTAPPFQQVAIYGTSSDMILQNNLPTVSIAQTLVVDASCLRFEESESPLAIPLGSESPVLTSTAASSCSLRRSWINGYQLFTKVNHPKFRDKWPQLQGRDITKLLSQVWKELPGDSKKHYSRRAREWNQWHRRKREPTSKPSKEE